MGQTCRMSTATYIRLDAPCHVDPASFVVLAGSRYCGSCAKPVHDFTRYTDAELLTALRAQPLGCGSFRADQLDRNLAETELRDRGWSLAAISVLLALQLFSADYLGAQTPTTRAPMEVSVAPKEGEVPFGKTQVTVFDELGEPLGGANVRVLDIGGALLGGTATDTCGRVTVDLPSGAHAIEVTYIGLQTATLEAIPSQVCEVAMESVASTLAEVVVVAYGRGGDWAGGYSVGVTTVAREETLMLQSPEARGVYPNPSPGQTTVPLHRPGRRAQLVNIYTAQGRLLSSKPVDPEQSNASISLPPGSPAGSYLVEVLYTDGMGTAYPWEVIW